MKEVFFFYALCLVLLLVGFVGKKAGSFYIEKTQGRKAGRMLLVGHSMLLETGLGKWQAKLPKDFACLPKNFATAPHNDASFQSTQKRKQNTSNFFASKQERSPENSKKFSIYLRRLCKMHFSESLARALLFQEDQAFFRHQGFSTRELRVSVWRYLWKKERLRGASTITQQLARSLFGFRSRSLKRKFIEFRVARFLEERLSKDEILELYLNAVYFGHNRYGISRAARFYFGKSPARLSRTEEAFLVALLPSPEVCRRLQRCKNKRVLARMKRILRQKF